MSKLDERPALAQATAFALSNALAPAAGNPHPCAAPTPPGLDDIHSTPGASRVTQIPHPDAQALLARVARASPTHVYGLAVTP